MLAINCTGDLARTACSSFAAWGPLTENGHTIAGRNMDWPAIPAMLDTMVVHVNVPPPDSGKIGWAAVTWPTYIGCLTGMNAEGVTVATHDARGYPPSVDSGFTPYGWTFRKALESARAASVVDDIAGAIRDGVSVVGNNMMVNCPYTGQGSGAFVFEFDGDLSRGGGLTIRKPPPADSFLVCTNHFRQRAQPIGCGRYTRLEGVLRKHADSQGKRHIDHKRAWKMLAGSSTDDTLTYHSVVFEPNERLMHVAFTEDTKDAPGCRKVTLDVARLVAGDYPGGR